MKLFASDKVFLFSVNQGSKLPGEIPLPSSTRGVAAKRLMTAGMIYKVGRRYRIKKKGIEALGVHKPDESIFTDPKSGLRISRLFQPRKAPVIQSTPRKPRWYAGISRLAGFR